MNKSERYKAARLDLGYSRYGASKESKVANLTIKRIETGNAEKVNPDYTEFLVKQGINYLYLIGLSSSIKGSSLTGVIDQEKHESVKNELYNVQKQLKELTNQFDELKIRYRTLENILLRKNGGNNLNLKKHDVCYLISSCVFSDDTRMTHANYWLA